MVYVQTSLYPRQIALTPLDLQLLPLEIPTKLQPLVLLELDLETKTRPIKEILPFLVVQSMELKPTQLEEEKKFRPLVLMFTVSAKHVVKPFKITMQILELDIWNTFHHAKQYLLQHGALEIQDANFAPTQVLPIILLQLMVECQFARDSILKVMM